MTWAVYVFRGDPDDLDYEERFAPLDLERARTAISSSEAVTDGGADVEERGDHVVIGRDATLTDILLVRDGHGVGRAVESEVSFHPVPPAELRADLQKLLGLFFTLGDELDAWVFDHFVRRFVARGETDELLATYGGGFSP